MLMSLLPEAVLRPLQEEIVIEPVLKRTGAPIIEEMT